MDLSLNSLTSKKKGLPQAPTVLAGAERREAERSEADRSAAPVKTVADPPAPVPNIEVVADAKRRSFTLDYKLRILAEAVAAKSAPGGSERCCGARGFTPRICLPGVASARPACAKR